MSNTISKFNPATDMNQIVAALPGTAFGDGGEGYLGLCFASPRTELREGLERIEAGLSGLERE